MFCFTLADNFTIMPNTPIQIDNIIEILYPVRLLGLWNKAGSYFVPIPKLVEKDGIDAWHNLKIEDLLSEDANNYEKIPDLCLENLY